jgi:MFS family permease
MIQDFDMANDASEVGKYTGFIVGGFYFGRMLSSAIWGDIIDKFGRKPGLALSILSTTIFVINFGLADCFSKAVGFMTLIGFFNGLSTIGKTLSTEINFTENGISDNGSAWALSFIFSVSYAGSLIGTYIGARFLDYYPEAPYLMSGIVCSGIGLLTLLVGLFCLDETLIKEGPLLSDYMIKNEAPMTIKSDYHSDQHKSFTVSKDHKAIAIPMTEENSAPVKTIEFPQTTETEEILTNVQVPQTNKLIEMQPVVILEDMVTTKPKKSTVNRPKYSEEVYHPTKINKSRLKEIIEIMLLPQVAKLITIYSINTFFVTMIAECIPIWLSSPIEKGGLGFSSQDIGNVFLFLGLPVTLGQIFLYPCICKWKGEYAALKWGNILVIPASLALPYGNLVAYEDKTYQMLYVATALFARSMACFMFFSSLQKFTNDSVPSHFRGRVNGLSMALGSGVLIVGPIFGGATLSWSMNNGYTFPFNYHLVFMVGSVVSLISLYLVYNLKGHTPQAIITTVNNQNSKVIDFFKKKLTLN